MKASFITAVAAMAGSAFAAPTPATGLDGFLKGLKIGNIAEELKLKELPVVSKISEVTQVIHKIPSKTSGSGFPSFSDLPSASGVPSADGGHLVQDLGPEADNILTVVGPDASVLLIELSPEVTSLVSGLGLPALGAPLGSIVASASGLGELVTGLGPVVDKLVTVVGADAGALLIELSPEVAGLVSGLGLPAVGVPVGTVVATLGKNLKRGEIVQDVAPKVKHTLTVTGQNAKQLLIELSPPVTSLVAGLGLTSISGPIGSIVAEASGLGDLVKDVAQPIEDLLHIVGKDGKHLLIKLSPNVVELVTGLGLPTVATPLGAILTTVAENL
ncbi:uncharacterized protein N7515_003416 [Penicillium bovifimosum]|uniref:Uncharacterized protein n=1 Tax=Penicillium bovifimosum TaxID=126998 RepID=A0A9W9L4M5_9EURO|nr:uncharacterized protein N7515_003416 [Penicillium bovifimosum]KAJ5138568.1 hypothetical protein N7515_003416 [Penicillium bovifimosum]